MKFYIILACLISAAMAQVGPGAIPFPGAGAPPPPPPAVPPVIPPIIPPFLPFLGPRFLPFMPLMRPALLGRLAFSSMLFGPLGLGPLSIGPMPFGLPPLGKRSVENTTEVSNKTTTSCIYTSSNQMLKCNGPHQLECHLMPKDIDLQKMTQRVLNLRLVKDKTNKNVIHILSRRPNSRFTIVDSKDADNGVLISLLKNDDVKEPGLLVHDEKCWKSIDKIVKENKSEDIRLSLFFSPEQTNEQKKKQVSVKDKKVTMMGVHKMSDDAMTSTQ